MSPSKLYSSLAMGLPIVYVGPPGTGVDDAIQRYHCGVSVRQGDVDGIVEAVRRLRADRSFADELSRNARRAFEEGYSDRQAMAGFDALFDELVPAGARRSPG